MAYRISRLLGLTANFGAPPWTVTNVNAVNLVNVATLQVTQSRSVSFFNRKPQNLLWKSATSVSNPGRKRGRARNIVRKTNIYHVIGHPVNTVQFPGFTSPVRKGNTFITQRKIGSTDKLERKVNPARDRRSYEETDKIDESNVPIKMIPLRGWTSATIKGKKLGPPDPTDNESFEGFDSCILETRLRTTMHPTLGRVKKYYALCVTGNGNGTAGFADVVGKTSLGAIKHAKSLSGQKLITIDRYEDRTVLHDFYARFGNSKIMVKQVSAGHGLVCHRALKACCEAFGIKDIYAKSEGSDNVTYLIHAFFVGLLKQKTFQQMAEEKKLHVVEFRHENYLFPKVLASPSVVRTKAEIPPDENLDFNQYLLGGKVLYQKKAPEPFYVKLPSYDFYRRKQERQRDQEGVRIRLRAQYGHTQSFLADKYPEAKEKRWRKRQEEPEEA